MFFTHEDVLMHDYPRIGKNVAKMIHKAFFFQVVGGPVFRLAQKKGVLGFPPTAKTAREMQRLYRRNKPVADQYRERWMTKADRR